MMTELEIKIITIRNEIVSLVDKMQIKDLENTLAWVKQDKAVQETPIEDNKPYCEFCEGTGRMHDGYEYFNCPHCKWL